MKKTLMIIAMVAIVAIAGSMVYYFVFFRTGQEKAEIRLQEQKLEIEKEKQRADDIRIEQDKKDKEQQELDKKTELTEKLGNLEKWHTEALQKAHDIYKENWNDECKIRGLAPNSPLPTDVANNIEKSYQKDTEYINQKYQDLKDDIYKLYGQ